MRFWVFKTTVVPTCGMEKPRATAPTKSRCSSTHIRKRMEQPRSLMPRLLYAAGCKNRRDHCRSIGFIETHSPVADQGYPRGRRQPQTCVSQPIICQDFCWKLHGIERIWTQKPHWTRHCSLLNKFQATVDQTDLIKIRRCRLLWRIAVKRIWRVFSK